MKIYNTLTKRKDEFEPLEHNKVKMYVCGPTVYDYFHIGNARSFIMADVIRKYFIYRGYQVKFVMNLTDVDDKIIKKANEEKVEAKVVAERFTGAFFEDIKKLKIKPADVFPKATEHIDEILNLIKKLEEKNIAYNVNGNVFYDVLKFKDYGKLSGKKIDELEAGARIEVNESKTNPLDFALWKKAKEGEPYWNSPWGNGRPGWHIECSAMSMKHLGESFDIHAGGHDLIFPHHENEIAQSEGATGKQFARYWIHFGFLNFQNEKMSKSLGNFFTARDVVKEFKAEAIRLFFCQTHYASPLTFSKELLESAEKGVEKIKNFLFALKEKLNPATTNANQLELNIKDYYAKFEEAMDDDFNTPRAVAVIFDFIKNVNKIIGAQNKLSEKFVKETMEFLKRTAGDVLGIIPSLTEENGDSHLTNQLLDLLVQLRLDAKRERNFKLADKIRDELNKLGILLLDTPEGTKIRKEK